MNSEVTDQLKRFYDVEMADRKDRPLGDQRTTCLQRFVHVARERGVRSVLEVGCGAGRDGVPLRDAGFEYTGIDLSSSSIRICGELGLDAVEALATDLPFGDDSFDAAWTMSTLMHLPADGFTRAISELRRVVRPGGIVEIGVWGHTTDQERIFDDGRYFNSRSDDVVRRELAALGEISDFDTWGRSRSSDDNDGGHYQWARVIVG